MYPCSVAVIGHTARAATRHVASLPPSAPRVHGVCVCVCVCCVRGWGRTPGLAFVLHGGVASARDTWPGINHPRAAQLAAP